MCVEIKRLSYSDCFKKIIKLKGKNMTEAIESYYPEFSSIFPSFIACSTGYGKTHFALKVLFKKLYDSSDFTLYLSNRTATDLQAKKIYIKETGQDYLLEKYTDKGLKDLERIGNVYFLTYQKLYKIINTSIKSNDDIRRINFKMVYCDEAEYFLSDSTFNYSTSVALDFIVNFFQYSIKIYISATPEPAFTHIYWRELINFEKQKEKTIKGSYRCQECEHTKFKSKVICDGSRCLIDFNSHINDAFGPYLLNILNNVEIEFNPILFEYFKDYDNVDFYFANSNDEYINYQNETGCGKSVINVETKKKGKDIHNKLQDLNQNSIYIDATNKLSKGKPGQVFNKLIEHEYFDEDYGIFTSILDNGINIVDENLKNIVFSTIDKNQAIQITGRKRLKEDERVNFIIINKTLDDLEDILTKIDKHLEAIYTYENYKQDFYENYINGSQAKFNFKFIHGIFYIDKNGSISYNDLAKEQLNYFKKCVVGIMDKIKNGDEFGYIKTVMSWFDRYDYNDDMWINYKPKEEYQNEFIEFLDKNIGIIKRNEYEDFRKNFFEKFIPAYGLNANESKDEIFAINKINKKFNECNLKYKLLSHKEFFYSLRKLNETDNLKSNSTYEEDLIEYLDNKLGEIEQYEYENFINNLVEKYIHAFIETRDMDMNKELSINKINSLFKEKGLMYEFTKHSGTYYELQKIDDEEAEAS